MERDIQKIISEMTLEEKAGLCSGADFWYTKAVERLGIPSVMLSDGPHGLRKQEGEADHMGMNDSIEAVCFPAACATASSYDPELIEKMGETLGEECQAEDLSVLLGPAVNIKRSPLCGRNFEYFSEDPYLTGKMASAHIRGVQKWDVGTSIKHFAGNNQEYKRMSVSSQMSERVLREIYLPGFEEAVKTAQPKTVMCSYNKINGVYSAENPHLLTEILRDEWGFEGYVVTDWGAVNDRVKGLKAGLDLEMPGPGTDNDQKIVEAVKDGSLSEDVLDKTVERLLKVLFSYVDHRHPEAVFDRAVDHEKAVKVETECAVLLQNKGALPLKAGEKIVYIGEYAQTPRYQGGGSSHIHVHKVDSALESAQKKARNISYVPGFPVDRDEENEERLAEAVEAARSADVAVIFAGLPDVMESEGYDRSTMKMPVCQDNLIAEVAKVCPRTVVVLHNGSPVECPWAADVDAVLEMYLGGEGVGEACDRLLWGEANPSGKLAETFPYHLEDNPSFLNFPGDGLKAEYAEGIYVGYRYYDKKKMPVQWAFGHGLSYTSFAYSNLKLALNSGSCPVEKDTEAEDALIMMKDNDTLAVTVDVTNTGDCAGKEVVQLYVSDKTGTPNRPVKELKGFAKVALEPGQTKTVQLQITARDLSFYHEELGDWYAPSGAYEILVGAASDDIRLQESFQFNTARLLPLHVDGATTIGELLNDPRTADFINQMVQGRLEQRKSKRAEEEKESGISQSDAEMMQAMMMGMPLKSLTSYGVLSLSQVEGLIAQLNSLAGNQDS